MSAIQFISWRAASLICHLGGGVSHLTTERGWGHRAFRSQLWIHWLKWIFLQGLLMYCEVVKHITQWCASFTHVLLLQLNFLACLSFTQGRAPNYGSAGDRRCTRGMLKASAESFACSSALCGDARLHTLSNHVGSEGRDPLHSELSTFFKRWLGNAFAVTCNKECPLSYWNLQNFL